MSIKRADSGLALRRRKFLELAGSSIAMPVAGKSARFRFAHVTDLHIQPELDAARQCMRCMETVAAAKPDFVVMGGDLVFDANAVSRQRVATLFRLYRKAVSILSVPVYAVVGNHDLAGIGLSGAGQAPMQTARKQWEDEIGPRFQAFDYQGWRFILLDSIGERPRPGAAGYRGWIEDEQLTWLRDDLARHPGVPKVVITHIPLVTGFLQYGDLVGQIPDDGLVIVNAREVVAGLLKSDVRVVLQGHTHICESVAYGPCRFVTTGAVSGDWWRGPRLGFPNGFGLIDVGAQGCHYQYVPYE